MTDPIRITHLETWLDDKADDLHIRLDEHHFVISREALLPHEKLSTRFLRNEDSKAPK